MPCYTPLQGFQKQGGGFTTRRADGWADRPLSVPCGQCIGCRLERSRQWAIRCVHEAQMHDDNCFITLTYDDDNLPYGSSLHRPDFQKFVKRLRKKVGALRLFYCGEYGETTARPHYHACIFGWRPDDPVLFPTTSEYTLFESPLLTKTWGMGHCSVGELTFESAAYTARYVTKKITGDAAADHYQTIDEETGEIIDRIPEFNGMSRRPGIGLPWLEKFGQDAYSKDEVILRSRAMKPPRAYDKQFEITDPTTWQTVKSARSRENFNRYHPVNIDPEIRHSRRAHAAQIITKQRLQQRKTI